MMFRRITFIAAALLGLFALAAVGKTLTSPAPEILDGHTATPWELLASIEAVDNSDDLLPNLTKTFPDEIRAAAGDFVIEGYLVRFLAEPYLQEFLLVPDPPECPFCGGAGYGPSLEVRMKEPLPDLPDYTSLKLRGVLELIEDPQSYEVARLTVAEVVE